MNEIIKDFKKLKIKKRFLEVFCGTKSLGIIASQNGFEVYSVDILKKYNPTKLVDVLEWNYKEDLKEPFDYVHFSPECTEFSYALSTRKRDIKKGMLLINKSFEILEYLKSVNPKIIWTMENPQGHLMKQPEMEKYKMIMTSYCKYGYPYRKNTCFWYGNIDLKLKPKCKFDCDQLIVSKKIHKSICSKGHYTNSKYKDKFDLKKEQKSNPIVERKIHKATVNKSQDIIGQGYNDKKSTNIKLTGRDLRYSIPEELCIDIINQVKKLI